MFTIFLQHTHISSVFLLQLSCQNLVKRIITLYTPFCLSLCIIKCLQQTNVFLASPGGFKFTKQFSSTFLGNLGEMVGFTISGSLCLQRLICLSERSCFVFFFFKNNLLTSKEYNEESLVTISSTISTLSLSDVPHPTIFEFLNVIFLRWKATKDSWALFSNSDHLVSTLLYKTSCISII